MFEGSHKYNEKHFCSFSTQHFCFCQNNPFRNKKKKKSIKHRKTVKHFLLLIFTFFIALNVLKRGCKNLQVEFFSHAKIAQSRLESKLGAISISFFKTISTLNSSLISNIKQKQITLNIQVGKIQVKSSLVQSET